MGEKAALIEAHTGQQSFGSYAKAHRDSVLHVLTAAADRQALHEGLARYGMEVKPHGSGLVVALRAQHREILAAIEEQSKQQKEDDGLEEDEDWLSPENSSAADWALDDGEEPLLSA